MRMIMLAALAALAGCSGAASRSVAWPAAGSWHSPALSAPIQWTGSTGILQPPASGLPRY